MIKITLATENRPTNRIHTYSILIFTTVKYFMNTSKFNKISRIISALKVQTTVNKAVIF